MIIKKIKNFAGHWFTCSKCGRSIKHAFTCNGEGSYGSECIITIAGWKAEKKAIKLIKREKSFFDILNNPKMYCYENYKATLGYNDDQMYNHYMAYNRLG